MEREEMEEFARKLAFEADMETLRDLGLPIDISKDALDYAALYPRIKADERSSFMASLLGTMIDLLMEVHVESSLKVLINEDKGYRKGESPNEIIRSSTEVLTDSSLKSWEALGFLLTLMLLLEDSIGTNIMPKSHHVKTEEITAYKAKIRSRGRS